MDTLLGEKQTALEQGGFKTNSGEFVSGRLQYRLQSIKEEGCRASFPLVSISRSLRSLLIGYNVPSHPGKETSFTA